MNVAPTNATQLSLSSKGDPSAAPGTTTRIVPDGDGTDLPADSTPDDTFGQMLSRGMTGLDAVLQGKSLKPLSLPIEPGATIDDRSTDASAPSTPRTDSTDRGRGFGVAVTDLVNVASAAARPTKTVDDGTEDALVVDDGSRHDDAAANDLAAQLALVSQWAGIAKPPVAQGAQGTDSLDLRDKLATVRGAAALPVNSSAPQTAPIPVGAHIADQPQDALSLPLAIRSPASTKTERDIKIGAKAPALASAVTPAIAGIKPESAPMTGKADPKTDTKTDEKTIRTTDAPQTPVEAAGIANEPGTVRTASDSIVTPTSAFAHQIAAVTTAIAAPLPTGAVAGPTLSIREQVGTPAWSREVGQATLRIATSDVQSASLQINPEHLGPVDVQVRIDNGVAHLSFSAAHADTRQALESSRATLDRLFADQGLKIGDCAVGDSSTSRRNADADAALAGQSQRNGAGRWDQASGRENMPGDTGPAATITTRLKALGLVDTFA